MLKYNLDNTNLVTNNLPKPGSCFDNLLANEKKVISEQYEEIIKEEV
jgi:hypothetical protein